MECGLSINSSQKKQLNRFVKEVKAFTRTFKTWFFHIPEHERVRATKAQN